VKRVTASRLVKAGIAIPVAAASLDAPIDAPLRRRVTVGFVVAVLLTGLLGLLSWHDAHRAAEDADWVAHTHEVLTTLELTLRHLLDVETGGRGFALAGEEKFLEPYETGRGAVGQDLQRLSALMADNSDQLRQLDLLRRQANARIEATEELIAIRRNSGSAATDLELERGKKEMDAARLTVAQMEAKEKTLLDQRTERLRETAHFTTYVIMLGTVLGVVFLTVAGFTASREIGVSARARAQVDALNADLERRVAQRTEALGESEGRLAGVIQSAMDSILTVDEQQNILLFNAAAERMFRCPASEALGQPLTRFIPQRFHGAHAGHIHKFAETGVTSRAMGSKKALWAVRADGQEFQIEASISQVVTGGKKLFTVILRDVTERVQAEQAVREAQDRMTGIIASAMDSIITTDDQQCILVFNAAAERMFRCPAAEALGQPVTRFIPQRFHAAHGGHIKQFGEKGVTGRAMGALGKLWAVRADGEEFRIEASISHVEAAGKKLFTVILRDITERVQAEEVREHLAAVVDSSDDAIISKDLNGTINAWNRGAEKTFGYSAAEAVGKPMLMLIPPERVDEESAILARTRRGESMEHFETVRVRKDGTKIDVSVTISPIRDSGGAIVGASKITRDITARKQAEAALAEQASVLDSAQVFVRDMKSRVVFWPRGAEKLYGFTPQEALGILSHNLFHTIFPEPLEVIEKKLFETGMWEGELIHTRRDGSIIVVSSAWVLHRNSQGQPIRILETNIDISERKQAEERLAGQSEELSRQAEELARSRTALETQTLMLQSVLDSMQEGLVAADEHGKFIIWNPAATKIVGLGAADVPPGEWNAHYGVYLPDAVTPFPPEKNPLLLAIHGEVGTAEMFVRNQELETGVWIEASASPLKSKDGLVRGGVIAFRDVTQRRADGREINKLNEELEQRVIQRTAQLAVANQELEAFTYSVSHDLRAPLRHIGGFSKILSEDFGPGMPLEAQNHLKRIGDGVHRMGLLVDELLNLARVGRHALHLQSARLNAVVEEVVSLLQPETEGRTVRWNIADLPSVECDAILVKQVFQNLLANAIKFTRPREQAVIEISHRQENGQTVFLVRDNGVGFSMKYTDKLFGVFQRLHRPEDFEGTGIGLATVKRIIHKHGGRVWAEAELDKGATFYFTLEAEPNLVKPDEAKPDEATPAEVITSEVENKSAAAGAQS
jgi:PAS domain S-box-containing protein